MEFNFSASMIPYISLLISFVSLAAASLAVYFRYRDHKRAKYRIENDYVNDLLGWHGKVVTTLMNLRLTHEKRQATRLNGELAHLSVLIEEGRFFFPNIERADKFGAEKPPAYRGYRNLALDFLVASYNLFDIKPGKADLKKTGILQRHFTSIVYQVVRPQRRLETIRSLTNQYFVDKITFADFLNHPDSAVLDAIWQNKPGRG